MEADNAMRSNQMKAFSLLIVAVVCAGSLAAQGKKDKNEDANARSVQGTVVDPTDKQVAGAVVQLKDMRTLQIRSFLTLEDGTYHFSGLKTDVDYQVKADYSGMSSPTRTVSVFDNRKVAIVNLKLEKK